MTAAVTLTSRCLPLLAVLTAASSCANYGHVCFINESNRRLTAVRVAYPDGSWAFTFGNSIPRGTSGYSGEVGRPPAQAEVSWKDETDGTSHRQMVPVKETLPKGFELAENDICFLINTNLFVSTAYWLKDRNPRGIRITEESEAGRKQRELNEKLMEALKWPNLSLTERCIAEGADVNSHRLASSITPISTAMWNPEALKLLFRHGAVVRWEFPLAARNGNQEVIDLLIANGADVNHVEPWNQSPLTSAIDVGSMATVSFLIERGADVNKPIYNGITPLYSAVLHGRHEIAKLLIERGAKVDVFLTGSRWTPLGMARQRQDARMVEILTQALSEQQKVSKP